MKQQNLIYQHFEQHLNAVRQAQQSLSTPIEQAAGLILQAVQKGNKLLCCGNGGSAGDASHIASELVNRFEQERPALPAIALTTDSAIITSIANDYHYQRIFARQIEALGQPGDLLLAFSTSGNSQNVIEAIKSAHKKNMMIIAFSGKDGGKIRPLLKKQDIELCVPAEKTSRIQEVHLILIHCICDLLDQQFVKEK